MTIVQLVEARRLAILNELNALDKTKPGGKPDAVGAGTNVQHVAYRLSLLEELKCYEELLDRYKAQEDSGDDGASPYEFISVG